MADYKTLQAEVTNDPLARGYASMTDEQVAADLRTAYRTKELSALTAGEIFGAIVFSEYQALGADMKQAVDIILGLSGAISVVSGSNARGILLQAFPDGTTTRSNLVLLVVTSITRAEEIGFPAPTEADVRRVR